MPPEDILVHVRRARSMTRNHRRPKSEPSSSSRHAPASQVRREGQHRAAEVADGDMSNGRFSTMQSAGEIIATGLAFPEGPVWRAGEVLFTEIAAGVVSRWTPTDGVHRLATTGGGPNGAALGPDGAVYVPQNGGMGAERTTAGIQ